MRLFLSSYRAGRHDQELLKFLGGIKKIGYISNAKDYKDPARRERDTRIDLDYWRSIGIEPTEIDLRPFFGKSGAENLLSDHKFIWLSGGNVFLLRRALKYTGLDKYLVDKVRDGSIIYGGESAGAILAGPTLRESELSTDEDSPNFIPEGYEKEIIWEGLGLVDFVPMPHHRTPDYGTEIGEYMKRLDKISVPHKEMTDAQAIVIDGDKEEFLE